MNIILEFFSSFAASLPGAVAQGLIWGLLAVGVYITFRVLNVSDLTVDGSIATGGAVCVMLIRAGVSPWLSVLVAFAAGLLCGLITGLFHTKCGIPAILAGILTQLILYSVNLFIMGFAANVAVSITKYPNMILSSRFVHDICFIPYTWNPIFVLIGVLAVIIVALYFFFGTELGCALRATGNNHHMSRANGINTDNSIILGLMLSNGLVAMAGALLSQYQGFADINMGRGAIVIGLAAVIIGEVIFAKIFKNFALKLLGVVLGAVIYYFVIQLVLQFGLKTDWLKALTAIVVALFLAIPYWTGKKKIKIREARNA